MEETDGNETEGSLVAPEELARRIASFLNGYYLIDIWKDRESYYALTPEDFKAYPGCICGLFVIHIMSGELKEAGELLQMFEEEHFIRLAMELVFPMTTPGRIIEIVKTMKRKDIHIPQVQITAGRPSVLNGVGDFTRFAPFLKRNAERFIAGMRHIYDETVIDAMYNLALAEWYYQQNQIMDAGLLVTRTLRAFDNDQQRRLLFVALYLQSKLQFASGKMGNAGSYIRNIRRFVRTAGEQEFSYNIDAAEAYTALYDGNYEFLTRWLAGNAPDELADFCMLDLYRYMVKIRCYIVYRKDMAVIALVERLRPLLQEGGRIMDLCELDLLLAISFFRAGEKDLAFTALERSLKIAKRRGFYRLVVDEGAGVLPVLAAYVKKKGETPFLVKLVEGARDMAYWYPLYLKPVNKGGATFSRIEVGVLKFLEQGCTKEEIADFYFVSVNTVRFHVKNIYRKLEASSVHQAVWEARLLGII